MKTQQGEIVWKCPHCDWKNIDDKEYTAVPMCFRCQRDVGWNEIDASNPTRQESNTATP